MNSTSRDAFSIGIGRRIEEERTQLAARWLARLKDVIPVAADEIFPSAGLLDHVPELIEHIGKFVGAAENDIASNTFVVQKAHELGNLRHDQQASVHQLLREYELLRSILESFTVEETEALLLRSEPTNVIHCLRRINLAVAVLSQTTVDTFIARYTNTIIDQNRRLATFNQMVSHELRQPLAALQTASKLLFAVIDDDDVARRARLASAIERNIARLAELVSTITKVSRLNPSQEEQPGNQRISLTTLAHEAARQLRDAADARGVEVIVEPDMAEIITDVGRLELILTNLLSNAIKYSDPIKAHRFVAVRRTDEHVDAEGCSFSVQDNGIGMDAEQRRQIFTPLYRGHASRDQELGIEGLGLGLTIVGGCVDALGGTISVESVPREGTIVRVRLPRG